MKLKEKKGERVNVFLLKLLNNSDENWEMTNKLLKTFLQAEDISLSYSENKRIISLFDKTDEQIECFTKALHNSTIQIDIEEIWYQNVLVKPVATLIFVVFPEVDF